MSAGVSIAQIGARLLGQPEPDTVTRRLKPDWAPPMPFGRPPVAAAVLIALVMRDEGPTLLYTERSEGLRSHSGQVAFPGGKIDTTDRDAADAALREAHEEIALERDDAKVLGFLPAYLTVTNYLITPVVARVVPRRPFAANPNEVRDVFEVPLAHLMQSSSFLTRNVTRRGTTHSTWQVAHKDKLIWGITANLTRRFYEMTLAKDRADDA